jgi:hypothetical protein
MGLLSFSHRLVPALWWCMVTHLDDVIVLVRDVTRAFTLTGEAPQASRVSGN